jgi:hypothetical protein
MLPPRITTRKVWRWNLWASMAGLVLLVFLGYAWHIVQPWIRANAAAREVEKTGAEVRRIVWSPVYLVLRGPQAGSQLKAASPQFKELFTVTSIIFEDAEVTPEMFPYFRNLRSLQVLRLYQTQISPRTLKQLQAEFPDLELSGTAEASPGTPSH